MTQVAPASLSVMTARGLGSSCAVTGKDPSSFLAIHSCIGLAFDAERNGATVGFLRGKPQDRNQSLCQKRAPWAPLQLIQPNNKQQITALAFRQEQSPRGQARKRGAYSSRLPMQGHHLGSRAGSNFIMVDWNFFFFFPEPSLQLVDTLRYWHGMLGISWENYPHSSLLFFKGFLSIGFNQKYAFELKM